MRYRYLSVAIKSHSPLYFPPDFHRSHVREFKNSRLESTSLVCVLNSWRNLRGDACRRPLVNPGHLREMPLTVLVDREGRIAISHAEVVDPLVFEADINALLAE